MTFILVDTADETHDLVVQNVAWRFVVEEVRRGGIVAEDRAERLAFHLCTPVTPDEAKQIAKHLLAMLNAPGWSERPGSETSETIAAIARFANTSAGFEVC